MRVTVYFQTAHRHEQWEPVTTHCPACGVQGGVYQQHSPVPMTHHDHICTACGKSYSLSAAIEQNQSLLMAQRIAALKG